MSIDNKFKTDQEKFWAGEFGNDYAQRNTGDKWIASNTVLFSKILSRTLNVKSILEYGSNIGLNLLAIRNILPQAELSAIEINEESVNELKNKIVDIKVHQMSIFDYVPEVKQDLVLIKGVLIHINPDELLTAYKLLYDSSERYICIVEYYNPTPVTIKYRGHENKLFKRDFAGELMDQYEDLKLVDYGFIYHRDNNYQQDDMTWFLLEK
jgi:pseudaminic acid biosynthesis-associated methylase